MCTAVSWTDRHHYFGRNLDLEVSFNEQVCITPRRFPFCFRCVPEIGDHHAIIGMAAVADGYPLYYDAVNERGLGMAGLNFPGNARYFPENPDKDNITPFEFIPWILSRCNSVESARKLLKRINLVNIPFSDNFPLSPLHWMISDKKESIVVESTSDGLNVYDNPVGVLTNNPQFPVQMFRLNDYRFLSPDSTPESFAGRNIDYNLREYSRGMSTIGLPGGLDSGSRFVRAAFTALNSATVSYPAKKSCGSSQATGEVSSDTAADNNSSGVSQFFHILQSVAQTRGLVHLCSNEDGDKYEITIYSSCCDTEAGIYYYTTYDNSQITGVNMYDEDLDGNELRTWSLIREQQIRMEN